MDSKYQQPVKAREKRASIFKFNLSHLRLRDLGYILYRNIFLLTNGIILAVVILLDVFGDKQAALFLGIISILNMLLGLAQDINAWLALEKLQLLTAPYTIRLREDGTSESVPTESVMKGDQIRLKIGDHVPCDSIVLEAQSLEINEGLITGESNSLTKVSGEQILAGSVVTAGSGLIQAKTIYRESRISRMTEGVKKYTLNLSPIQKEVRGIIKYSGYALIIIIAFIVVRGTIVHEPIIRIVKNIGAMSSLIVPAGLIFAMTLFFAYGAAHLLRRQVLLQEMSATEKLGRIKNLCMDKTGTITTPTLAVEEMHVPVGGDVVWAKRLTAAYMQGTNDTSQLFVAIDKFIKNKYSGKISAALAFSSWRQYGAVNAQYGAEKTTILAGSSDIFLPHLKNKKDAQWLEKLVQTNSRAGKHVLCIVSLKNGTVTLPQDLTGTALTLVAVFVFQNNLRPGIREAIDFFQNRGVHIRIISGDHPETALAIARQAGIMNADKVITGAEMESWSEEDYNDQAKQYFIFSRIMPEQKEKIIKALKKDGFTAMIGDGANDALAIKIANLGIAMFDGAPATRRLASVVLMNNSFAALPGGVELADTIITNLEIFASIFLNVSFVGLFFFIFVSILGFEFPLTPLNVTIINYFVIGIPGLLLSYWSIRPLGKARAAKDRPFLKRMLFFAVVSAIFQGLSIAAVYWLSPNGLKAVPSNMPVLIEFVIVGFIFFIYTLKRFQGEIARAQKIQIFVLALLEILLLLVIFSVPFLARFFDITEQYLDLKNILEIVLIAGLFGLVQYVVTRRFGLNK